MRSFLITVSWAVAIVTGAAFAITVMSNRDAARQAPSEERIFAPKKNPSPREVPITIEVFEYGFNPARETIKAGQAVAFRGIGKELHDVVAGTEPGERFFNEAEDRGSTRPIFTEPGTYPIVCSIHPQMKATIEVVEDF